MVDVVLDDGAPGADDVDAHPARPPREVLLAAARRLRHPSRTAVALGAGLALVLCSAGVARLATEHARTTAQIARLEAMANTLLVPSTTFRALWTPPSDLFSRFVAATDGLLVLTANDRSSVSALDADTGDQVWQWDLPEGESVVTCAPPAEGGDTIACVVAGADSGTALGALAVADGSVLARTALPDPCTYLSATDDADVLCFATGPDGTGTVTRRSPLDGTLRWTSEVPAPLGATSNQGLSAAVHGGIVQLNGLLEATLDLASGAAVVDPMTGASLIDRSRESADDYSWASAQELPDGAVALWWDSFVHGDTLGVVRDPSGRSRFPLAAPPLVPVSDDGSAPGILLLSTGLSVDAVDAQTGQSRWHAELGGGGLSGAVRYAGALDVVGSDESASTVQQRDLLTGDILWSTTWPGVVYPQLILAGDTLLIQGASAEAALSGDFRGGMDRLAVVDLRDGTLSELPWPADLPTSSWLLVLDHRLYGSTIDDRGVRRLG